MHLLHEKNILWLKKKVKMSDTWKDEHSEKKDVPQNWSSSIMVPSTLIIAHLILVFFSLIFFNTFETLVASGRLQKRPHHCHTIPAPKNIQRKHKIHQLKYIWYIHRRPKKKHNEKSSDSIQPQSICQKMIWQMPTRYQSYFSAWDLLSYIPVCALRCAQTLSELFDCLCAYVSVLRARDNDDVANDDWHWHKHAQHILLYIFFRSLPLSLCLSLYLSFHISL